MSETEWVLERYPHHVEIKCAGETLAETRSARLLIESHAPDIYVPFEDIRFEHLVRTDERTHCPIKGDATYWSVRLAGHTAENVMWAYEHPFPALGDITGHGAFYFDAVSTYVDGKLVRGHVRDPHKVIIVAPLAAHLLMELADHTIVNSREALVLRESGLPARFYVPPADVAASHLVPSDRQSVCTYKGEARYHHLKVERSLYENVVWSYPEPWLDFEPELGRIKGLLAFYTSRFDRVLIDGELLAVEDAELATDAHMLAQPTVDRTLAEKMQRPGV